MAVVWVVAAGGGLRASSVAPVFVLHSYAQEYEWTKSQHQGFIDTLGDESQIKVAVSTEYLDTKRRGYDETYATNLERHLWVKYAGYKPSAIYVTDDNALLFARDHLSRLFPGAPVFFSGINDYSVRDSLDPECFTGVFELKEIVPNLTWLLGMDPQANDLVFVGDGSNTYQAVESEARKALVPYHLRATFIVETRMDLALARLAELPGKYLFLTTVGGMTDVNGQVLPLRDVIRGFAQAGRVVISMEDGYVMEGVLGGWVTSGGNQGRCAARMLLDHLRGKPLAVLPPVLKSPNAYIFDDEALQSHGLTVPEKFRAQAVLLHPRTGFYQRNQGWIFGLVEGLAVLLFGGVLVAAVILSRRNRELRHARTSAEAANVLFNQLAEQNRTVHWNINAEGLYTYVSPVALAVLGYRPDELVGKKHFFELLGEAGRQEQKSAALAFYARKAPSSELENRVCTKDGRMLWMSTHGIPVVDDHGVVVGYRGSDSDVTERKQAEEELLKTNCHLAEASARAQEMAVQAQAATHAKSAFLAAMSHEIRTPLNGIIGSTDILSRTELCEEQHELVQIVLTSGDLLLSTIDDILHFSKIEAGQIDLEEVDFHLLEEVDKVLDVLTAAARKKGIELVFLPEPGIPAQVRGDVTRLRQVLVNLVGNAIKFTETGWVSIQCKLRPSGRIGFQVEDTGIGIPAEKMAALFKPFTQADNSTTRKYGGTGLGLTISHRLVQIMGGRLRVKSTHGVGSCFYFELPLPSIPADEPVVGWEGDLAFDLLGHTALVIVSPAVNQHLVQHSFAAAGGGIVPADSLEAGLAVLGGHPEIDLIVLDRGHAEAGGDAAVQALRSRPDGKVLPIILVAGDLQDLDRRQYAAVLQKPLKLQSLVATCRIALSAVAKPSLRPLAIAERRLETPLRVLLAEDNAVNQKIAVMHLKSLGVASVKLAANGREAVELWQRHTFDLVFMDCQMPEMDGYQATLLIREQEQSRGDHHHQVIIGLSAGALSEDRGAAFGAGMDDYLVKPVKRHDLSRALDEWA